MQYTVRNIPERLDRELRKQAEREGKSLNQTIIDRLIDACGLSGERPRRRNLEEVAGTWVEDEAVQEALQEQRSIDEELWE